MERGSEETPCGCTPGTWENGWHERRSEACKAVEREQWRATIERFMQSELRARLLARADDE